MYICMCVYSVLFFWWRNVSLNLFCQRREDLLGMLMLMTISILCPFLYSKLYIFKIHSFVCFTQSLITFWVCVQWTFVLDDILKSICSILIFHFRLHSEYLIRGSPLFNFFYSMAIVETVNVCIVLHVRLRKGKIWQFWQSQQNIKGNNLSRGKNLNMTSVLTIKHN